MVPAQKILADDFVQIIDSLRRQTHIPWVVYVFDFGDWTDKHTSAIAAITHLQLFCPRVHVVRYPENFDMAVAFLEGKKRLENYAIPVTALVTAPIKPMTMRRISEPFLDPEVDMVPGRYDMVNLYNTKGALGRLWYLMTRRARTGVVAYRNHNYKGGR
jgi:hypothetical protein